MARFDVLLTGYVHEDPEGDRVRPTVSLVRTGDAVIVVDPGICADARELTDALAAHGLAAGDVTHVFVTHHHLDHTRNAGMFPGAVVLDGTARYDGDLWADHDGEGYALGEGVSVLLSPGHAAECASLVVETDAGTVVCTHAWWFADRTPEIDPLAVDQDALVASREKILAIADLVVPGHGGPFAVARHHGPA